MTVTYEGGGKVGSSPRVRGRPPTGVCCSASVGLIPAGAGQTGFFDPRHGYDGAHPRGCGADGGGGVLHAAVPGSSPRVRGRQPGVVGSWDGTRAHPRGCGADLRRQAPQTGRRGSSPRVRGRRPTAARRSGLQRLIPAGAGQTVRLGSGCRSWGGSSPRVRGRHIWERIAAASTGLIPAGAGQTQHGCGSHPTHPAHPRGCGADILNGEIGRLLGGSSPRVRGRRRCGRTAPVELGLIPAGAGQTRSRRKV